MLDTVAFQLVSVGCAEDLVPIQFSGDDLANDVLVGEAYDQTVFRCIVFVFGLGDESFASVVICLALTTALVFSLEATAKELAKSGKIFPKKRG